MVGPFKANMALTPTPTWLLGLVPLLFLFGRLSTPRSRRPSKIALESERVLVIGASSGIGRAVAHRYSSRHARVCIFGRRKPLVDQVTQECTELGATHALGANGDFSNVDDMVALRERIENEWNGLDTVIVAAGVSSLQPLLALAGASPFDRVQGVPQHTTREGIQRAKDISHAATTGNFYGPLVSAVTLIPLLEATSASPAILLVSSLAAVVPAPTRALYAATKSAALLLYESLSIEHPQITFTHLIPATVEGDFRQGAVDGGPVREEDPSKRGLKREEVAKRCVRAIDREERHVYMSRWMKLAPFLYWLWPRVTDSMASKKYRYRL